jgi:hypothetical protein
MATLASPGPSKSRITEHPALRPAIKAQSNLGPARRTETKPRTAAAFEASAMAGEWLSRFIGLHPRLGRIRNW